ncbi:dihydroxyacetone kinase subunit DhaK [Halanaerobium kushneri]|uniref:Dihydroxyacetone kinase DhaK subunit n=1 Tax=Halanaerobium kushneri TaxID=56779 RepID=A0A1N6S1M3_9FIRM|nr:dihydroxyacetone kinase subunit DhaK [Halanaerobium kushneri]SIQ34970.1 dihydroxyacetone kinase DhaK subunit [Halanaerobium kushneri]
MKKKLINKPENVVSEMIEGIYLANQDRLRKIDNFNIVVRKELSAGKVALISGGGSGHEPAHAGYVGRGMLDAAVSGAVFTSPTPDAIYEAIKEVDSGSGVLMVVKNYTGDVMNFEMAAEMAAMDDIEVEQVIVNDDIAVEDSLYTTGRRGVAGTVFVHKIAGAEAEKGSDLKKVVSTAEKVIKNVKTKGVAINPCRVPGAEKSTFSLSEKEIEMGIGIHGEPGTERQEIREVDQIVEAIISELLSELDLREESEVALMINGMGGTPLMELYIANRKAHQLLEEQGIAVYKTYVGEYMTSLEMAGLSVTLLKLDPELKELLDAETEINL